MRKIIKYLSSYSLLWIIPLGLTPIVWFWNKPGVLINGVDTNFPLDPAVWIYRRLFVWDSVNNGGVDFSFGIPGLFFHFIQFLPYSLGFTLQSAEIFSYTFWFCTIVVSAYIFARKILPKNLPIQFLFVVLYAFNIYLFNTWENMKVTNISLMCAIPLGLAILISIKDKTINYPKFTLYTAILAILLSGAGINPAYFIVFFLTTTIYLICTLVTESNLRSVKERVREFILFTLIIALINCFWILPLAVQISTNISPTGSLGQIGFTNWVDSLSVNTNILNVMRMQGAWDWYAVNWLTGEPVYIPYATNYFHRFPFVVFSFLLPTLCILGLIFMDRARKSLYLSFSFMLIISIFLGAGTHEPTGQVFKILLNHLPFFSLFRSPWYIFTPLLIISTAGLISLFFYNLMLHVQKNVRLWRKVGVYGAVLTVIVGNMLYSYPLITGKIFRPGRQDSFYVKFPSYLFETKDWIKSNSGWRIVGYPDDGLERFNWGYTGVDSIFNLFSQAEVMNPAISGNNASLVNLIREFYESLYKGETESVKNSAFKLGIGTIFEKQDQSAFTPNVNLSKFGTQLYQAGKWKFYNLFNELEYPKIHSASLFYFGYPYSMGENMITALDPNSILLNPNDTQINDIPGVESMKNNVVLATNSQVEDQKESVKDKDIWGSRLRSRNPSKVEYRFFIPDGGQYRTLLERYSLEEFGIPLSGSVKVLLDGKESIWNIAKMNDSYVYFEPIPLSRGHHSVVVSLQNNNLVNKKEIRIDAIDKDYFGEVTNKVDGDYSTIFNRADHDLSAVFDVNNMDILSDYLIQVKYKHIFGRNAAVLVNQWITTPIKADLLDLRIYPDWESYSFYYQTVRVPSNLRVAFVAKQSGDHLGTEVWYKDLTVTKVFSNEMLLLQEHATSKLGAPQITFAKKSPVLYEGSVTGGNDPHILIFSENYSPNWDLQMYNTKGKKINVKPLHFSANLYANAWYIDNMPDKYTFQLYYSRQNLLLIGGLISVVSLIVIITLNLSRSIWKK